MWLHGGMVNGRMNWKRRSEKWKEEEWTIKDETKWKEEMFCPWWRIIEEERREGEEKEKEKGKRKWISSRGGR
jgi:hypothetical protein